MFATKGYQWSHSCKISEMCIPQTQDMELFGSHHLDPRLYYDVVVLLLLVRAGDVETNPGPTGRRSVAQGPSTEEQVFTLNTQV